ncbi:hypothetical protein N7463_002141 [Penicillium fimorum]|uniref:Uncharacterized protein n=1 Tax=Penicillium fimorum TaxID=1882269 RepID=A0A9W9XYI9_9EURO|nr:hypothetical protein N7463_002141 [Penicillium fimorum]
MATVDLLFCKFGQFDQFDNFTNITLTLTFELTIVLQCLQVQAVLAIVDASQTPLQRRGWAAN